MTDPRLARPIQGFEWSMKIFSVCLAALIVGAIWLPKSITHSPLAESITAIIILALVGSGFSFYIFLGILAKRFERSWIMWCGLAMLSSPWGLFVAYFLMRNLLKKRNPLTPEVP